MARNDTSRDPSPPRKENTTSLKKDDHNIFRAIVEESIISIVLLQESTIVYANRATSELSGYSNDELMAFSQDDLQNIVHEDDRAIVIGHMANRLKGEEVPPFQEFRFIRKNGDCRWVRTAASMMEFQGKPTIQVSYQDITDQKTTESEKERLESHYREIFDEAGEMISLLDIESMKYIHINSATTEATGYTLMEMQELGVEGFTPRSEQFTMEKALDYSRKAIAGDPQKFEWAFIDKAGIIHSTVVLLKRIRIVEKEFLLSIAHDVSEMKRADEALQKSEEKFRSLFKHSPSSIVFSDLEGNIIDCNQKFVDLHAVKDGVRSLIGTNVSSFFPEEEWPRLFTTIQKTIETRKPGEPVIYSMLRQDGSRFIGETLASVIRDPEGNPIALLAHAQDITERNNAEIAIQKSEKKYRTLFDDALDMIHIVDTNGIIIDANQIELETMGYSREEYIGKPLSELIDPDHVVPALPALKQVMEGKEVRGYETVMITRGGEKINVEVNAVPEFLDGDIVAARAIIRDITERIRAREQLEASLEEKIVLLKEIHHRVKNNLQIISSLLDLQTYSIEDEEMRKIFQESQNRIKSMALIHETLYRSSDFRHIDVREYIRTLLEHAQDSFGQMMTDLDLKMETDDITLNLDTAIPCGLMINELVSNALKYAFPVEGECVDAGEEKAGVEEAGSTVGGGNEIIVELLRSGTDSFRLRVSDNGVGLPPDIDPVNADTLGLQLVSMLVEQLHGDILINRANGTEFIITFSTRNAVK